MENRVSQKIWMLITVIFAIVLTCYILTPLVLYHCHYLPSLGSDGGKNIYVYLYQILYGKGMWFDGMNYPYGENIIYTDAQPLLSVALSFFKIKSAEQSITVMWYFIALSYVLSIIYVYKILTCFKVNSFFSIIFSGIICFMSPQIFRITCHFGLAYNCVIPMIYYWTIRYNLTNKIRFTAYIFILGIISSFLHPYFSAVTLVWVSFYVIGYYIFTKGPFKKILLHIYPLVISVVLLFTVIGLIMKFTDPVTDRPIAPYGTTVYCVTGNNILTSVYSPIWHYIKTNTFFKDVSDGGEGFCYLGIVVILAVIGSFISIIKNKKRNVFIDDFCKNSNYSRLWLFIALCSLLLSMGVPFVWNMEWLLDYVSFFRQFRTLGRFSWIFYYLITIYGTVVLYNRYLKYINTNKRFTAFAFICGVICLWLIEFSGYIVNQKSVLNKNTENYNVLLGLNGKNWIDFLSDNKFKPNDFQAILTIKFFEIGTDKLWVGNNNYNSGIEFGIDAGLQLHLPIIDAFMARSSLILAKKQVKIVAGQYVDKPMLYDLNDNRPILLIQVDNDLDPDEKYLLTCSDFIGQYRNHNILACYPDRIKSNYVNTKNTIITTLSNYKYGDTCLQNKGQWYINHFDEGDSKIAMFGNKSQSMIMHNDTTIVTIPFATTNGNTEYEFSCWLQLNNKNFRSPKFKIELLDLNNKLLNYIICETKESKDNYNMWFRANSYFIIPAKCKSLKIKLLCDLNYDYDFIDEMMLRPADAVIISKSIDGKIMVNNHLLN